MSVGESIKAIRISYGETMNEFGERFGTGSGAVNNWEKELNKPNKKRLKKIAELGNTTVEELLNGKLDTYALTDEEKQVIDYFRKNEMNIAEFLEQQDDHIKEIENSLSALNDCMYEISSIATQTERLLLDTPLSFSAIKKATDGNR